jgi:hypothetical protein
MNTAKAPQVRNYLFFIKESGNIHSTNGLHRPKQFLRYFNGNNVVTQTSLVSVALILYIALRL